MRHKWPLVSLFLAVVVTAAYATVTGFARPAPDHHFFEADRAGTQVIAHRGGAGLRPENTLLALEHAVEIGADILEIDVQLTADGAMVLMHDRSVDRTTDGHGPVAALSLRELRKLDAGYRWSDNGGRTYPFRGKGVRVPMLEEVLERLPAARLNIEMKHAVPALAGPLCALIRGTGAARRVLVASMNEPAIVAFRETCPEVATSMSRSEAWFFFGAQLVSLEAAYTPPVRALQIPYRLGDNVIATSALIAAAHRRNLKVHVWTINDVARMNELIRSGVDGIVTDRPDSLLALLPRGAR